MQSLTRAEWKGVLVMWAVLLSAALMLACGDEDRLLNTNGDCPAGHRAEGPACVPVFDPCPGEAEIPVLGGGCRAVGVTQCATGFASDGAGGCEPILPSTACGPDTLASLGHTDEIADASLAGIFFHLTRGTVSRSHVYGGSFSVVMNPGAAPTVAEDNVLSDLTGGEPTWINLDPGPAPTPALPSSLF